jgi:hypothetical protein
MNLNDLLRKEGVDAERVLVLRHRPHEPELNKVLPWLAEERPDVFNAYQQTQGKKLEDVMKRMAGSGYVASFIGHQPGNAVFIGLYAIRGDRSLSYDEYWEVPAYQEMKAFGMQGWTRDDSRTSIVWFDLELLAFYATWKGRLVVSWPPPERSWWRRAHRNDIPVFAILEDNLLVAAMPEWDEMVFSWEDLGILPSRWKAALAQWRGIYYIFDSSDRKGYVGSAYGKSNLFGRWLQYASQGHGGNRLLKQRDPSNFRFSILQRVSPDLEPREVVRLESAWKDRLHSRRPFGLNDN